MLIWANAKKGKIKITIKSGLFCQTSYILKACILLSIGGCIAAAAITYLPTGTPISFFYIISAIAGFTLIGWNAALMALVAELAGLENVGSVMGVAITIGWTGIFVAPPIFGFIADTAGYTWSWLLVLCCAGANAD